MVTAAKQENASAPAIEGASAFAGKDMEEVLQDHGEWLDSGGETGMQADLSRENLEGADLIDAALRDAVLNKTILKGADLMLADLRGANMLQANLEETNLLGTRFQQANLQAAVFRGATGLLSPQLAGANLFGAVLPETVVPLEELKLVRGVAIRAGWLLALTLVLDALVWLRIFTTSDAQLLKNASALPFAGLPTALPFIPFYLFGPVMLLSLYVGFHLHMQRVWEGVAQLPAIFPDGSRLNACLPWYARWPALMHFKWLRDGRSALAFLEAGIAVLLLYWIAPVTLVLFWGRYLTLEDLRGTTLQILLVVGSVVAAMSFPRMVGKAFLPGKPQPANEGKLPTRDGGLVYKAVPLGVGLMFLLLSVGTILGVPHAYRAPTQSGAPGIQAWAPDVLWFIGYNPVAQFTEADVSTKPAGWTGRDEEIVLVKGPSFNGFRLRYLRAYGAFLVKARFWQSDLRNAYLSEADLREANLRQADLRSAVLDRAKLARANLLEADLRNATIDLADLRDANLSSAQLSGAALLDATLDGATLYKSDLSMASLQRASLKRADLRESNLENANLVAANLQEAYLDSAKLNNAVLKNADLSRAILTGADLRKSDLSGARFEGTVLAGANLSGASLEGADLRGALGLTAKQVCSAANSREAQMDDILQQDVAALCGTRPSI